jgi:hypothetical protein
MSEEDFPALYGAADAASNETQAHLLLSYKLNSGLLIAGATTALTGTMSTCLAIVAALLFGASLIVYVHAQYSDFQGRWYQARALAESVKTATWRLMMSAEPFASDNQKSNLDVFRKLLTELLQDNSGIGKYLAGEWANQDQVTARMREVLAFSFEEKKQCYLKHRIEEQRAWYARRANENRGDSRKYFALICGAYAVAIVLLLVRIAAPGVPYLPIDVLAIIASSIIGWKQLRRFDELASAYGLTAHEVGVIHSRYDEVVDAKGLCAFVSDSENAFSREHTQWAARRDH